MRCAAPLACRSPPQPSPVTNRPPHRYESTPAHAWRLRFAARITLATVSASGLCTPAFAILSVRKTRALHTWLICTSRAFELFFCTYAGGSAASASSWVQVGSSALPSG